jgi:nicotinamide riboside kinase
MEKDLESFTMKRVFFITGSESTGKSTLTEQLARHFRGQGFPEYARTYLESLGRPYSYSDVENIARGQIELIQSNRQNGLVFFDTCLIILKVWFREVYGRIPDWLESEIPISGAGIYLLCEPDLPWEFDPLRENPHRREYLSEQYEIELKAAGFTYFRVFGTEDERLNHAIEIVNKVLISGTEQK